MNKNKGSRFIKMYSACLKRNPEYSKGFTLIELLVVIAIIGILSSVVLASLNTARSKGADAAIKSNLNNMRAQSAIYYDDNGGYSTAAIAILPVAGCTTATSFFLDTTVVNALAAISTAGGTATCSLGGTSAQKPDKWAISSTLKVAGTWCVDSAGASKATASVNGACS